jgi:hypothetical protein
MAVKATALTTTTNFKTAHGVSGSTDDTLIEKIIDRTTAWIESRCQRKFKARDYGGSSTHGTTGVTAEDYIYFDGQDQYVTERNLGEFHVPQWPIQKSTVTHALAVELAVLSDRTNSGETWDTTQLVENDDYVVDYAGGVIRLLGGVFTEGVKNYRLTCTAGYQEGSAQPYVPDDLEQLCIELGGLIYRDRKNLQSEKIGTWSRTFDTQKEDPFVADVLAKYTRIPLC